MYPKIVDSISTLGDTILFGGTFDPIQNGHIFMANIAKKTLNYNSVAFIPSKQNPLKSNAPIASDKERLKMLELALASYSDMFVWNYEITSPKTPSYTIDTIKKAKEQNKDSKLAFLTGTDVIEDISKWKNPEEILSLINQWIVVQRGDDTAILKKYVESLFEKKNAEKFYWMKNQIVPISSTDIRTHISDENLLLEFLPPPVLSYIREKDIYR